jgi:Chromo (CHRromatin Organisation MOdifier) domain
LSRVPSPDILQPDIDFGGNPHLSSKAVFRQSILRRVERPGKVVGETVPIRQQRYKNNCDRNVQRQNTQIKSGDLVYVKTFVTEPSRSPKLEFPSAGPFAVISNDVNTFLLCTRGVDQRVSSDRIIKAGVSLDLLPEMQVLSRPPAPAPPSPDENPYEEFVMERLLSHGVDDDGNVVMRVRWFGFGSDDDTWEPTTHLPKLLVERYAKRNKMAIKDPWPNSQ